MKNELFISTLRSRVQKGIETVEREFLPLSENALNRKPAPEAWSILECLEHLNRYNRFYNQQIEAALKTTTRPRPYRPGRLGGYFIRSVSPDNAKPMRTMSHLNPTGSELSREILHEFLQHQRHLLTLLDRAAPSDLNRRRVPVEVLRLLRIKTGDALDFVVTHQERHLRQALRVNEGQAASLAGSERGRING